MRTWVQRRWRLSSTARIYLRELIIARKGVVLGFVGFVAGMATLPADNLIALVVGLMLILLGVVQVSWEIRQVHRSRESHLLRAIPVRKMVGPGLSPALTERGYSLEIDGKYSAIRNASVDACLTNGGDCGFSVDPELWRPDRTAVDRDLRLLLLAAKLRGGQVVFEDDKVRLMGELTIHGKGELAPLSLQRTRYTSGLWTNDVADQELLENQHIVFDGTHAFTRNGVVCPLEVSECANAIGVSTLAFDPHGTIYLVQQGPRNSQSPSQLAPSGSGSADWRDLGSQSSFSAFITSAAERELREELGLQSNAGTETIVVGFLRWVRRGGKPEFLCLTKLPRPLARGDLTADERIFTHLGGAEAIPLPLDRHDASRAIGETARDRRDKMSAPLYWCLRRFEDILGSASPPPMVTSVYRDANLARPGIGDPPGSH